MWSRHILVEMNSLEHTGVVKVRVLKFSLVDNCPRGSIISTRPNLFVKEILPLNTTLRTGTQLYGFDEVFDLYWHEFRVSRGRKLGKCYSMQNNVWFRNRKQRERIYEFRWKRLVSETALSAMNLSLGNTNSYQNIYAKHSFQAKR